MMISEWLEMTKTPCDPDSFELINYIYMWHPSMPDSQPEARKRTLMLWNTFGLGIFTDMHAQALEAEGLYNIVRNAASRKDNLTHDHAAAIAKLESDFHEALQQADRTGRKAASTLDALKERYKK